jgi:hypothetical protein
MKLFGDIHLNDSQKALLEMQYNHEEFPSKFHFLKNSMGLRQGQYHLFLGETGSGKTSLIRSVMCEVCTFAQVCWLSTEEGFEDFKWKMAGGDIDEFHKKNISFIMEMDEYKDLKDYFSQLESFLVKSGSEALFFDNYTTSWLSRQPVWVQELAPRYILDLAKKLNIPIVVIAHTKKASFQSVNELMDADSVRGNQTLVNRAPYLHIMQTWKDEAGRWYPLIRNRKARFHDQDRMYALHYDGRSGEYVGDREIPYSEVLKIFRSRRRLTDDRTSRGGGENNTSKGNAKPVREFY